LNLIPYEYDSIFIRRGDKLVEESSIIYEEDYLKLLLSINPECNVIFLQTDDYNSFTNLQDLIIKNNYDIKIYTLCEKNEVGTLTTKAFKNKLINNTTHIDKNKDNIFKGKNVILVNTDDPWYINKEFTIPQKYIDNNLSSLDNNLEYDYGDFNSYFNINNKRADLGYGYSYASRLGEKCNEHFTNTKKKINENNIYDNDYTSIIILLCILLIIIFLYRRF